MHHDYKDLIAVFNREFLDAENTELLLGEDEPIYLPADNEHPHNRIIFARGFFASALHELAHWCVAGPERRKLEDYGYWYEPDGRDAATQAEFEKVEIKPQALEWILSASCGFRFNVSCDNLSGVEPDRATFTHNVRNQVLTYLDKGIPARAKQLSDAFRLHYGIPALTPDSF